MSSSGTSWQRLENESMSSYKTRVISQHLLSSISKTKNKSSPLIVGLQGPQGSGKTTVTTSLKQVLSSSPHNLNVAIYSLDDLYLPHSALESIKTSNPNNKLLHGRGQPGTHDLPLGTEILQQFSTINDELSSSSSSSTDNKEKVVDLPIYDKSAFEGQGDRSSETIQIKVPPKLNLVIFEGWCLGFKSLNETDLEQVYNKTSKIESESGVWKPYFLNHSLENLKEINRNLKEFEKNWYPFLEDFIQLLPESDELEKELDPFGCETVFKWRFQAEEDMKSKNGGRGMNEAQVRSFVERYFPSYELFSSTLTNVGKEQTSSGDTESSWRPNGLRIVLGSEREVKRVENF